MVFLPHTNTGTVLWYYDRACITCGETSVVTQVKVMHDVTACTYKIKCDKPVSKWSFQTNLEEQQKDKLVERLKVSSGLVERTKELGVLTSK